MEKEDKLFGRKGEREEGLARADVLDAEFHMKAAQPQFINKMDKQN